MLLIPLGEVSLAVSVLTTTIRRALVVRLVILLQKEVTLTLYSNGYYKHSSCPNSLYSMTFCTFILCVDMLEASVPRSRNTAPSLLWLLLLFMEAAALEYIPSWSDPGERC